MVDEQESPVRTSHVNSTEKQQISYIQEGNSTSSNEDDTQRPQSKVLATKQRTIKLAPHAMKLVPQPRSPSISMMSAQDKREMKRKKLHKRSKRTK